MATDDSVSRRYPPCVGPSSRGFQFWDGRTIFRYQNDQVSQGGYGDQHSRQRDSAPFDLLDDEIVANLKAPSKLAVNTPPLSPLPLKSRVPDIPGEFTVDISLENGS